MDIYLEYSATESSSYVGINQIDVRQTESDR